jgi:transcriptional regulator with GAF, ATPase, and Fis domain
MGAADRLSARDGGPAAGARLLEAGLLGQLVLHYVVVVARALHDGSTRAMQPFVPVNCAALTPTLIESELFGHEKGAFTGAEGRSKGAFEEADGGTLFLDEVGELSLEFQAKLLRALESGEVKRVGSSRPFQMDVRVVAATNRDLLNEARQGRFRMDLYYRLSIVPLVLPSLRERRKDIRQLAEHFLRDLRHGSASSGHPTHQILWTLFNAPDQIHTLRILL